MLLDGPPLEVGDALQITEAILEALSHSHHVGIIHRDIKPANVMLTETGTVKVMDFGIARAVDDTTSTSLTQTATVIGTAQYLSPEQARGESVDARSDIYSTGCVLYELLVGRTPFVGDSALSVAYQHVHEDPLPPSRVNPDVTPQMDAIVLKALAKDPDDRFPTAEAMATEIRRVLAGGEALATTQVVAAPLPRWPRRRWSSPRSARLLPAATAVAPAGLIVATPSRAGPSPPRRRSPRARAAAGGVAGSSSRRWWPWCCWLRAVLAVPRHPGQRGRRPRCRRQQPQGGRSRRSRPPVSSPSSRTYAGTRRRRARSAGRPRRGGPRSPRRHGDGGDERRTGHGGDPGQPGRRRTWRTRWS